METWLETSFSDLYKSTVNAFPKTAKRQHAIDPVVVEDVNWLPYLGMNTLLVRGLSRSSEKVHKTLVLFKNVSYYKENQKGLVVLKADGEDYYLEQLSFDKDILLRCSCEDFYWRFNYFNHLDKSLYGVKRAKYEAKYNPGSANPKSMPGMCKHLIKLVKNISNTKIIS